MWTSRDCDQGLGPRVGDNKHNLHSSPYDDDADDDGDGKGEAENDDDYGALHDDNGSEQGRWYCVCMITRTMQNVDDAESVW